MKILTKLCVLIAFAALGTAAFAAMNGPTGLALDAKGNLYVANFNSNEIQVYNLQHALVTSKTITTDVSGPMAVALDPLGNLWVANFSSSSITGYTPKKRELTPITTGISNPTAAPATTALHHGRGTPGPADARAGARFRPRWGRDSCTA